MCVCVCVCVCVWFLISMVSQQEGLSTACLSSAWSLNSVVFYQQHGFLSAWSFIRMVSLSLRWSFIGMVSHQDGLSSAWSFIRKVFRQDGLSQHGLTSTWSLIIMLFHQHDLSSELSFVAGSTVCSNTHGGEEREGRKGAFQLKTKAPSPSNVRDFLDDSI